MVTAADGGTQALWAVWRMVQVRPHSGNVDEAELGMNEKESWADATVDQRGKRSAERSVLFSDRLAMATNPYPKGVSVGGLSD